MAGNPEGAPAVKAAEVWWGDTRIDQLTFDITGKSFANMGWVYKEYILQAATSNTRLRFRGLTSGVYGLVIDDVSVTESSMSDSTDSDGDGLPDSWETSGPDIDGNGLADFDLASLGANKDRKDLFVWLDWLEDPGIIGLGGHSHRPDDAAIDKVVDAFQEQGISLHVIMGHGIRENSDNRELGNFDQDCKYKWQEFDDFRLTQSHFHDVSARRLVFRYGVFGHDMAPIPCHGNGHASGVARDIPGSDLLITLGQWTNSRGSIDEQAGTFMHELGHTLGLGHGGVRRLNNGGLEAIHDNYKPNHLSVMNYHFQMGGLVKNDRGGIMDFQQFGPDVLPVLQEGGRLNEATGFGAGAAVEGFGTSYWCQLPTGIRQVVVLNIRATPIDWDCDGQTDEVGVTASVNRDSDFSELASLAEWPNLRFQGGAIGLLGQTYVAPIATSMVEQPELTIEEDRQMLRVSVVAADHQAPTTQASVSPEPASGSWHRSDVTVSLTAGDGQSGSGIHVLTYEATGAQPVPRTAVARATASIVVTQPGATTITYAATDLAGNAEPAKTLVVQVDKAAPVVTGSADRPPNGQGWYAEPVTVDWSSVDPAPSSGAPSDPANTLASTEGASVVYTSGQSCDPAGNCAAGTITLSLDKTAPTVGALLFSRNPKAVSEGSTLSATVGDALSGLAGGEYYLGTDPGAGSATPMTLAGTTLSASIGTTFTPGVYVVGVRSQDKAGNWSTASTEFLVIFDPAGGYVTGGGWFASPPGACRLTTACEGAIGRANFGFVSRYQRGATVPTGQTAFEFRAGTLSFHSTSYEWLVIAGARAQYKGEGTINGQGRYGFLLTAIDGQESGGGGTDKLRIKIWDLGRSGDGSSGVVYDNQSGAGDGADPATAIGGGSIVIHR